MSDHLKIVELKRPAEVPDVRLVEANLHIMNDIASNKVDGFMTAMLLKDGTVQTVFTKTSDQWKLIAAIHRLLYRINKSMDQ